MYVYIYCIYDHLKMGFRFFVVEDHKQKQHCCGAGYRNPPSPVASIPIICLSLSSFQRCAWELNSKRPKLTSFNQQKTEIHRNISSIIICSTDIKHDKTTFTTGSPAGTFHCVIAGIQEPRRGKGLVDHSAGLGTGHWVDLVEEGPVDGMVFIGRY